MPWDPYPTPHVSQVQHALALKYIAEALKPAHRNAMGMRLRVALIASTAALASGQSTVALADAVVKPGRIPVATVTAFDHDAGRRLHEADAGDTPRIISYASAKGACKSWPCKHSKRTTASFQKSVHDNGIPLELLGTESKWKNEWVTYSNSFHSAAARTAVAKPRQLLCMVDSSDVVMQVDGPALATAYKRAANGKPLVMVLETFHNQFVSRLFEMPNLTRNISGIARNTALNGGIVCGEAWAMRDLWDSVRNCTLPVCQHKGHLDPQKGMTRYALQHPEMVTMDEMQRVAAVIKLEPPSHPKCKHTRTTNNCINGAPRPEIVALWEDEWPLHWRVENGVVLNRHTTVRPALLHFPGLSKSEGGRARLNQEVLKPRGLIVAVED